MVFLAVDWNLHDPPSGSQNYTAGFSGPPAFRLQILELLSLHNHASQFLIINYICVSTHTHPVALVSLEKYKFTMKSSPLSLIVF